MKVPVLNMAASRSRPSTCQPISLKPKINVGLMHQYVVLQMANARLGTHKTKRRGEVNRTHAKWYRQKGTGRARHGTALRRSSWAVVARMGRIPHKYTKDMPQQDAPCGHPQRAVGPAARRSARVRG